MSTLVILAAFALGATLGALATWWLRAKPDTQALRDAFASVGADALRQNGESFLRLARAELERAQAAGGHDLERREQAVRELLAPLQAGLARYDAQVARMERDGTLALARVAERLQRVEETGTRLGDETRQLVRALRATSVRGRWGEVQLRRVVELAGMLEHCDFTTQETVGSPDARQRPDMIVKLPAGRTVAVDAKVPLAGYLEAMESSDDVVREARLRDHARQVRAHVDALAKRAYWEQFAPSPEFVILFLPGDAFWAAALEQDPALLEDGARRKVIVATPTTLVALLQAVAFGWREDRLAQNAEEISRLGRDLHDRLATMAGHVAEVGRGLDRAVGAYNRAVGSLESRVMVSARRFRDLGATSGDELPVLEPVESLAREPGLLGGGDAEQDQLHSTRQNLTGSDKG